MKTLSTYLFASLLIMSSLHYKCMAQSGVSTLSSEEVFGHFDQLYKVDARLVNGDYYQTPQMGGSTGHPFFIDPSWKSGELKMEGLSFKDLQLRYDISQDLVILNTANFTNTGVQLILKKDRIEYFTMNGNRFEPYPDDDPINGIRFCQVVEEGKVDFLLVRSKDLKVTTTGQSDFAYREKENRILRIDDDLKRFRNRKTLYKAFPVLKPELKAHIKNRGLSLRKMRLPDYAELVAYCNTLLEK